MCFCSCCLRCCVFLTHVVASLIFLNAHSTTRVWAFLRVGHDPVCGLRLVLALFIPSLEAGTIDGGMVVLAALETETVAAATLDCKQRGVEHAHSEVAALARTPAHQTTVLYERANQIRLMASKHVRTGKKQRKTSDTRREMAVARNDHAAASHCDCGSLSTTDAVRLKNVLSGTSTGHLNPAQCVTMHCFPSLTAVVR